MEKKSSNWKITTLAIVGILLVVHTLWHYDVFGPSGFEFKNKVPMYLVLAGQVLVALPAMYLCMVRKSLTTWIIFSMLFGVMMGYFFPEYSAGFKVLSKIFIQLVKTIIAPILISTLVVGIAGHSNIGQVGRMGWKSILYFEVVTTIALIVGLVMINITQAGVGVPQPPAGEALPEVVKQTWQEVVLHIFPENIAKSIVEGQVLQIVVFAVLFGIGLAMVKEDKRKPMLNFMESLAETMFKFTNIIMYYAPIGIFGAMASTVGHLGIGVLANLIKLVLTLYLALIVFVLLVLVPIMLYFKIPPKQFVKALSEPVSVAFATTSSESALPLLMENLERFGVPRKTVSFVLPMGYSFNLDGTTLYLSLAAVFVAQATNHPLAHDYGHQLLLGLTLMLTSKGVAGVPRASLVILIGVCTMYNMELWPVAAILGIDELMDMARTSVNVIGNALASCVIARSENEFDDAKALSYENPID